MFQGHNICKIRMCGKNSGFAGKHCTRSRTALTNAALSGITAEVKWKWDPSTNHSKLAHAKGGV